jgi:hypothetical protein
MHTWPVVDGTIIYHVGMNMSLREHLLHTTILDVMIMASGVMSVVPRC